MIIETIFMSLFVIAAVGIIFFLHKEGRDERGYMIFAKASRKSLLMLVLCYISLTVFERITGELSIDAYRSVIFYIIYGLFIILALLIQFYKSRE